MRSYNTTAVGLHPFYSSIESLTTKVTELLEVLQIGLERVLCTFNLQYFTDFRQAKGPPTSQSLPHRT